MGTSNNSMPIKMDVDCGTNAQSTLTDVNVHHTNSCTALYLPSTQHMDSRPNLQPTLAADNMQHSNQSAGLGTPVVLDNECRTIAVSGTAPEMTSLSQSMTAVRNLDQTPPDSNMANHTISADPVIDDSNRMHTDSPKSNQSFENGSTGSQYNPSPTPMDTENEEHHDESSKSVSRTLSASPPHSIQSDSGDYQTSAESPSDDHVDASSESFASSEIEIAQNSADSVKANTNNCRVLRSATRTNVHDPVSDCIDSENQIDGHDSEAMSSESAAKQGAASEYIEISSDGSNHNGSDLTDSVDHDWNPIPPALSEEPAPKRQRLNPPGDQPLDDAICHTNHWKEAAAEYKEWDLDNLKQSIDRTKWMRQGCMYIYNFV